MLKWAIERSERLRALVLLWTFLLMSMKADTVLSFWKQEFLLGFFQHEAQHSHRAIARVLRASPPPANGGGDDAA